MDSYFFFLSFPPLDYSGLAGIREEAKETQRGRSVLLLLQDSAVYTDGRCIL
jgi:hypothetical protein